jgi:hypothetical protein
MSHQLKNIITRTVLPAINRNWSKSALSLAQRSLTTSSVIRSDKLMLVSIL